MECGVQAVLVENRPCHPPRRAPARFAAALFRVRNIPLIPGQGTQKLSMSGHSTIHERGEISGSSTESKSRSAVFAAAMAGSHLAR